MKNSIYTVGQVNIYIKRIFEQDFMLRKIYVRGEISNCKYASSGHIYFSLKDETGVIRCVMFAGDARRGLKFRMNDGDRVVVGGRIGVYERSGVYQLYALSVELEGEGLLYQKFAELKKRLEEMGMFAAEYKQPIPKYAKMVGVVTAETGAAIRDIQNISFRRNPYIQMILAPAQVQGEGAAESIVRGIHALEDYGVDVIIVGRGGGSIEDLWAFNEEIVARAVFDCQVPVISAVGHETDFTITDYVADLRAPTPSAAAELAVFDIHDVLERLDDCCLRMKQALRTKIAEVKKRLETYRLTMESHSPKSMIDNARYRTDEYMQQMQMRMQELLVSHRHTLEQICSCLETQMERVYRDRRHRLELLSASLDAVSPLKKLSGGYAYLSDQSGHPLNSVKKMKPGSDFRVTLRDGKVLAEVLECTEEKHHE